MLKSEHALLIQCASGLMVASVDDRGRLGISPQRATYLAAVLIGLATSAEIDELIKEIHQDPASAKKTTSNFIAEMSQEAEARIKRDVDREAEGVRKALVAQQ